MAHSAWRDRAKPEPKLPHLEPFFGPQPGWGNASESGLRRVELYCLLDPQEVVVADWCPICGPGHGLGEALICMGCHRSSADPAIAAILEGNPPPGPDTPEETVAWRLKPDHEKYPDRRPAPPGKPPKGEGPIEEPTAEQLIDAYLQATAADAEAAGA